MVASKFDRQPVPKDLVRAVGGDRHFAGAIKAAFPAFSDEGMGPVFRLGGGSPEDANRNEKNPEKKSAQGKSHLKSAKKYARERISSVAFTSSNIFKVADRFLWKTVQIRAHGRYAQCRSLVAGLSGGH